MAPTNETNQEGTDEDESDNDSDVDKFRDGVEDYFMFDDWGMLGESNTWDIAAQDYKKEVKRRFNQPSDAANVRNISPFFNDIEGLLNDGRRVANALSNNDAHALGKLAPELLLKILAVALVHKGSVKSAARRETNTAQNPSQVAPRVTNTANHIFGEKSLGKHNLGDVLNAFNGDGIAAFNALEDAAQKLANQGTIKGVFETSVEVAGQMVTIRGAVIDGVVKVGTAFIP